MLGDKKGKKNPVIKTMNEQPIVHFKEKNCLKQKNY